mmetsp:Transcript_9256/g.27096  ORF Transcript_9256/g.27096 Transcript_9256/m.27096 type:complete len:239 (-) Transcript_9256:2495-3211(-)
MGRSDQARPREARLAAPGRAGAARQGRRRRERGLLGRVFGRRAARLRDDRRRQLRHADEGGDQEERQERQGGHRLPQGLRRGKFAVFVGAEAIGPGAQRAGHVAGRRGRRRRVGGGDPARPQGAPRTARRGPGAAGARGSSGRRRLHGRVHGRRAQGLRSHRHGRVRAVGPRRDQDGRHVEPRGHRLRQGLRQPEPPGSVDSREDREVDQDPRYFRRWPDRRLRMGGDHRESFSSETR